MSANSGLYGVAMATARAYRKRKDIGFVEKYSFRYLFEKYLHTALWINKYFCAVGCSELSL
jgi:hypothetical protein